MSYDVNFSTAGMNQFQLALALPHYPGGNRHRENSHIRRCKPLLRGVTASLDNGPQLKDYKLHSAMINRNT